MRKLLLASLSVVAYASPVRAQGAEDLNPVIQVKYAAPPRAVYLAALEAFEKRQVPLRARLLDQALLTTAEFGTDEPGPGDTATVVYVEITPEGDSTQLVVQARVFPATASPSPTTRTACLPGCWWRSP